MKQQTGVGHHPQPAQLHQDDQDQPAGRVEYPGDVDGAQTGDADGRAGDEKGVDPGDRFTVGLAGRADQGQAAADNGRGEIDDRGAERGQPQDGEK